MAAQASSLSRARPPTVKTRRPCSPGTAWRRLALTPVRIRSILMAIRASLAWNISQTKELGSISVAFRANLARSLMRAWFDAGVCRSQTLRPAGSGSGI